MPEMDGFEATRAIRQLEREQILAGRHASHIPIVALTANAIRGDRERCIAAGMDGYVTKPIDAQQLLETVGTFYQSEPSQPVRKSFVGLAQDAPPIDLKALRRRCIGNEALVRALLDRFQSGGEAMTRDIDEITKLHQPEKLLNALHSLKGASGNLAADRLFRLAIELEENVRAGNVKSVTDLMPLLHLTSQECVAFARSFLSGSSVAPDIA